MATARKWSNVAVALQSAAATALTITAISKANPGVVTYTGTDPSNGDYVLLSVSGMFQLDKRVARVANVNGVANTFELEGINTTSFDTFTSGTCQVITLGTSVVTATTITPSGGEYGFIDTTTIHSNVKTQMPGPAEAIKFDMDHIWDPSDTGLLALKAAYDGQSMLVIKFTIGTGGPVVIFAGYVGAHLLPGGQSQGLVTTKTTFTVFGSPTYYSS